MITLNSHSKFQGQKTNNEKFLKVPFLLMPLYISCGPKPGVHSTASLLPPMPPYLAGAVILQTKAFRGENKDRG